ncbi:MAG TPA: hypothetical protein VEG24_02815, partial [Gaiellaceae bacterium]|nr:hypothetical protein [Gaiellaceae bacterium]
ATPAATPGSLGVGELDVAAARAVATPPNPNAGLDQYVTTGSDGAVTFDSSAWQTAAASNPAWGDAAWGSAAQSDAAWASAAWASAAWGSTAWSDAAWGSAAESDAAWGDAAGSDLSLLQASTNATDDEIAQVEADLGIVDPVCDPILSSCSAAGTP